MSGKLSERRRHAEENESEDYADVIRNVDWIRPDWTALNGRIIDEFGHAGLLRISVEHGRSLKRHSNLLLPARLPKPLKQAPKPTIHARNPAPLCE